MIRILFLLDFSPVAISIGFVDVYWYGIVYAVSIFLSYRFANYIVSNTEHTLSQQEFEKFMFSCIVACIVGARLGHILFFEPLYYAKHPVEVIMLRNGGLSFHGAVLGLAFMVYRTKHNKKIIADILAFAGAIGIFLGRIANFINQELYGIATDVNWAVIFSKVDSLPRHPTQLYESIMEGLLSFWIMLIIWNLKKSSIGSGIYACVFLSIYSLSRFFIEFFKEVEVVACFDIFYLTIGQILSVFLFLSSFLFLLPKGHKDKNTKSL
jgi:phosphatidylglycerol:prolipoprotein diacylglycerol transferase